MRPSTQLTDNADLAAAAMHGDASSLNTLLACVRPRLYAYALRICRYNTVAEDAIQDAFLHAYLHLGQLREPSAFYPWLRSIVKRSAWKQLRSASAVELSLDRHPLLVDRPVPGCMETALEEQLANDSVYAAIDKLTETLKMPLLLRYFSEHQEYRDIAEILSIPVGTVRSRLNEAKKQLQRLWSEGVDLPASLAREAGEWNDFYRHVWTNLYDADNARRQLSDHMAPDLALHFTSGAKAQGRALVEREIEADLHFGSRSVPTSVFNLGDIGIVECSNQNSAEFPDRCPPRTTFILHRNRDQAVLLQLHHASRQLEAAAAGAQ